MSATELEQRITEATTTELVRALIADFKAYKDAQLSDLTGQVNAAQLALAAAQSELAAAKAAANP